MIGLRTTRPASPPLDARSRLWALASAAFGLLPLLLQLPATTALAVGVIGFLSASVSWRRPIPLVLRVLLAIAALAAVLWAAGPRFGRDTGCALLAAMLAIKPTETTSLRDGRSLVGFALFAPFAAFLLDQGPMTMALGLVSVLCALVAMLRLAALESGLLSANGASIGRTSPWQIGRLVAMGLPLVLLTFWLFPRLGSPLWGLPDRAVGRPGLSDTMRPGEWIDLLADDTPAARVTFFGPTPRPSQMYWRGPVMSDFDGRTWRQAGWPRAPGPVPVTRTGPRYDYQLDYEPTDRRQLIALDLASAAPDGTRLSDDYELSAQRPLSSLTRWRLQSQGIAAFDPQPRPEILQQALRLPPGFNPRTIALGQQWRSEAGTHGDAAIVQRALTWIRKDFAYTLDVPLPGRDIADDFLFQTRRGFCEHFSSSFVILMRAAGIPARVVTGYVGGMRNPLGGGYWIIRRQDAHAWTEVWLPQRGWVRVDPTAAVAPERIYDTLDDRAQVSGDGTEGLINLGRYAQVSDWLRSNWNNLVLGFNAERQSRLLKPFGVDKLDEGKLGLLFALAGSAALLGMAWLLARGEREADPLLRQWHRLGRRYRRLGLQPTPSEPALAWAQRVAMARSDHADTNENLISLSHRFAQARYASCYADVRALIRDLRRHRP
jgi:transglutaminase-like putative cysteine protease